MRPAASTARQPWRWPLGWLFGLGLAAGLGFWVRCAWLWLYWTEFYHNAQYYWLALWLWMPVAGLGLLGLVMTINNLIRRKWLRALGWLLLAGLAVGHCAAGYIPLIVSMGAGTTLEVPKE